MKFDLNGQMPDYLLAKDIILQIIGDIGVAGATYRSMEFGGDAIGQVRNPEAGREDLSARWLLSDHRRMKIVVERPVESRGLSVQLVRS